MLDLRLAVRRALAQPGFTLVAVLSLAFGLGATTVFFAFLNATLLKPLPIVRAHEVFSLVNPQYGAPVQSHPNYLDLKKRDTGLDIFSYRMVPMNASLGAGRNLRMWGYLVSGDYFQHLGIAAFKGRLLGPDDDRQRGGHPVVVLTHRAWQRHFAGDPAIAGRTFLINGLRYTVVGVTPPGFIGTERFYAAEAFLPVAQTAQIEPGARYLDQRGAHNSFLIGRLKPGVRREQAQQRLDAVARQLAQEFPKENEGLTLRLTEAGWAGEFLRGGVVAFSTVLIAVAGLLLLVVCVNLATLLLARASERRKETAVRLALGASRGDLIRQLLVESALVSAAGGLLGALLAVWSVDLLSALKPPIDFALETRFTVDAKVLAFTAAVTLATSILLGLAPAWRSTGFDLAAAIKNEAASQRERRWPLRDLMTGAQIALSVLLLVLSGLMIRSLGNAMNTDLGFDLRGVAITGFDLALEGYDRPRGEAFQRQLLQRVRALPGVESAAFANALPLDLEISSNNVYEYGQPQPPASKMPTAQVYEVSPGYFAALKMPILAGREYAETDTPPALRLVVNESFARRILRDVRTPADAVGRRVLLGLGTQPWEIIGVAADGKYLSLADRNKPVMFQPTTGRWVSTMRVVARTSGDPRELLGRLRQTVLAMDPNITLFGNSTLDEHLNLPLLPSRVGAAALGAFALVTLLLAAIGIYGTMAFAVARRTREIGVRVAIGATPRQVAGLVLSRTALIAGAGAAIGLMLAALAGGFLKPLLIGVQPVDPLSLAGSAAVIALVALVACLEPVRRALAIAPIQALRQE